MFEQTYKLTFYDRITRATQSVDITTTNLSLTGIKKVAGENHDPDYNTLEISNPIVVNNRNFRGDPNG